MKKLGNYAQKVLLYTLPWMVFGAFALTVYVLQMDEMTFIHRQELIFGALELLGRLCVCIAVGTVLADIAERRKKKTQP